MTTSRRSQSAAATPAVDVSHGSSHSLTVARAGATAEGPDHGPTLARIRTFLEVVDKRSIPAVTSDPQEQSRIIRKLGELQAALGRKPLLVRQGRERRLTTEGAAFESVARAFVAEVDRLRGAAPARQKVRCVAADSVLQWVLLPVLTGPLSEDERVLLSVAAAAEPFVDVRDHRADMAVDRANNLAARRGYEVEPLPEWRLGLFVPATLRRDRSVEMLPAVRVTGAGRLQDEVEQQPPRPLRYVLEVETYAQAVRAVSTGRVAAILPEMVRSGLPSDFAYERAENGIDNLVLVARRERMSLDSVATAFRLLKKAWPRRH